MEQKKILWVILSVSVFVLAIFGIALFLYSPSRAQNTAESGGEMIPYEGNPYPQTAVDPEKWARDPDKIAELDKTASPAIENIINLNIVANDPAAAEQKGIDVSGLTGQEQEHAESTAEDSLPVKLAEGIGINTQAVEKPVEKQPAAVSKPVQPAEKKPVKSAGGKKAEPQKKPVQKPTVVKAEQSAQKQTLYWVQTASLASRINAERARDTLAAEHMKVEIFTKETSAGLTHRVRVGPFSNHTEASYWLKNIQKLKGFENSYVLEEQLKS